MKKVMKKLVPILLVSFLALPSAALAKGVEDSAKMKSFEKEKTDQSAHMNAMWSRFDIDLDGNNGKGVIVDNNPVFDFEVVGGENGNLANGDSVLINVINRGGNVVKQLNYSIEGLEVVDDVDETEDVDLYATNQNLGTTYGAVRFLNFNNLATSAEVYLTDAQENLGTSDRTSINFYRGTTVDGEKQYGDWEERNKVRFGYDAEDGKVWVELNAEYEYREEYDTVKDADFDAIQFMLLNRESDSAVKLENIKLNGKAISDSDTVLVGDSDWPKWNLEGEIQNSHGNFMVEADLLITGDQPKGEINKLEIMFGKK